MGLAPVEDHTLRLPAGTCGRWDGRPLITFEGVQDIL